MSKHKKPKGKTKGPLIVTVALIVASPVCLAEQALADAPATSLQQSSLLAQGSSFQRLQAQQTVSSVYGRLSLNQLQSGLTTQPQNLPRNYPSSRLLASPLLSISQNDVDTLESTLSTLKIQLNAKNLSPQDAQRLTSLISETEDAIKDAKAALAAFKQAQATLSTYLSDLEKAKQQKDTHQAELSTAEATLNEKQLSLQEIQAIKTQAQANLDAAEQTFNEAQTQATQTAAQLAVQERIKNESYAALAIAQANFETAQANYNAATTVRNAAQAELTAAQTALAQAQYNYDHNLIPDPTWTVPTQQVAHTRDVTTTTQVPHTTTTTTQSANILPALSAGAWVGGGSGFQGSQPAINNGEVRFSYMQQSVTYTGQAHLTGQLTLQADTWNYDQNNGGQDTYSITLITYDASGNINGTQTISVTTWHDWTIKTLTLTPTSDVHSYKVILTGYDGGYWYGTYGPAIKNVRLAATQTTTTTTYETVTTTTQETYYTTEPVLTQGNINVNIGEGGSATFNAPTGATFISSNLRYESYNNPQCGRNIAPNINGLSSITIQALNSVWGDPCGGQVKHVVGTISYLGQPTAPLIHNPELLPALEAAQATYDAKLAAYNEAQANYNSSRTTSNEALAAKTAAEDSLNLETQRLSTISTTAQEAQTSYEAAQATHTQAQETFQVATSDEQAASDELITAETSYEAASQNYTASSELVDNTTQKVDDATAEVATSSKVAEIKYNKAQEKSSTTSNEIEATPELPKEGSQELPAEITADSLLETDLTKVDPTEMTPEQAEAIKEAALEVFETATEGSPEYEQALDALYLAAEQDDIVLDPALAAVPGLAAATELVNFFGNAGSDMSPARREESKKVVVTAVVAAGTAVQAAAAAATTASAGAASSSGSSRRTGK